MCFCAPEMQRNAVSLGWRQLSSAPAIMRRWKHMYTWLLQQGSRIPHRHGWRMSPTSYVRHPYRSTVPRNSRWSSNTGQVTPALVVCSRGSQYDSDIANYRRSLRSGHRPSACNLRVQKKVCDYCCTYISCLVPVLVQSKWLIFHMFERSGENVKTGRSSSS